MLHTAKIIPHQFQVFSSQKKHVQLKKRQNPLLPPHCTGTRLYLQSHVIHPRGGTAVLNEAVCAVTKRLTDAPGSNAACQHALRSRCARGRRSPPQPAFNSDTSRAVMNDHISLDFSRRSSILVSEQDQGALKSEQDQPVLESACFDLSRGAP